MSPPPPLHQANRRLLYSRWSLLLIQHRHHSSSTHAGLYLFHIQPPPPLDRATFSSPDSGLLLLFCLTPAFSASRSKADTPPPLDPAASSQIQHRPSPSAHNHLSRILQLPSPRPTNTISVVPKHVSQIFSLLQGSTEPHVVVASLASDKSIWEALMKSKVIEFSQSPPPLVFHTTTVDPAEGVVENKFPDGPSCAESEETFEGLMFIDIVDNLKTKGVWRAPVIFLKRKKVVSLQRFQKHTWRCHPFMSQ